MNISAKKIYKNCINIVLFFFLATQVFSFSLSFFDEIYGLLSFQQIIIDGVYFARNVSFLLCIIIIFFSRRIYIDDLILILFFLISYVVIYLFFPENVVYFQDIKPILKYAIGAYVVVRSKILSYESIEKYMIYTSRLMIILLLYAATTNTIILLEKELYMPYSNAISISVAILLYSGIIKRRKIDILLSIISLISILRYGSRGSFLTLGILCCLLIWLRIKNKYLLLLSMSIFFVIFLFGNDIITGVAGLLIQLGIKGRSIEKILLGNFLVSNDRLKIYEYLINIIEKHMFFGCGICGDRYYLPMYFSGVNATYAHNFFIEIMVDYGFIIGTLIIFLVIFLFIRFFVKEKNIERLGFCLTFFTVGFLQLMVSRSWLTEQNFFILIAFIITYSTSEIIRSKRLKY